ncbi:MAG: hypothetical protein GY869_30570, partial [Planctomycetes bacterium]|nr:hypothetical protein [Planctomycetota bacterium]
YYWQIVAVFNQNQNSSGLLQFSTEESPFFPPRDFSATGNGQNVDLQWNPPYGGGSTITLQNDNGTTYWYITSWNVGDRVAAKLDTDPANYPFLLQTVEVPFYDHAGVGSGDVIIRFYELDESGGPGDEFYATATITNNNFGSNWLEVDISPAELVVNDAFIVAVEFVSGTTGTIPSTRMDTQTNIDVG